MFIEIREGIFGAYRLPLFEKNKLLFNNILEVAGRNHRAFAITENLDEIQNIQTIGIISSQGRLWLISNETDFGKFEKFAQLMPASFICCPTHSEILHKNLSKTGQILSKSDTVLSYGYIMKKEKEFVKYNICGGGLRHARKSDFPIIESMLEGFFAETYGTEAAMAARTSSKHKYYVWEDKGVIRSISAITCIGCGIARVNYVYTLPQHRCRGYGHMLVWVLSNEILRHGLIPALNVSSKNRKAATMYEAIGYEFYGELDIYSV